MVEKNIGLDFYWKRSIGLNVAMSGISWWTTDIGGHLLEYDNDMYFLELLVRWFQFGCFSPIMRMHGKRDPNEVWSFGENNYLIFTKYMKIREKLKPYILHHMKITSESGTPMLRPMFFDYYQRYSYIYYCPTTTNKKKQVF